MTIIRGRTQDLRARIAGAKVLDPRKQPEDEVRFGASVTMQTCDGKHPGEERRISIVGVDEADATEGRVAFVAPIARALLGRKVGERTTLRAPHGEEILEIIEIAYALE
ncbi:MAG: GreA/GreB family elongation factor [Bacteroidetes bacterium]|nr:GreA/GreB family elongation factor [Bacteroidota bacterium]